MQARNIGLLRTTSNWKVPSTFDASNPFAAPAGGAGVGLSAASVASGVAEFESMLQRADKQAQAQAQAGSEAADDIDAEEAPAANSGAGAVKAASS